MRAVHALKAALGVGALAAHLCMPVMAETAVGLADLLSLARDNDSEYRAAAAARDAGLQARVAGRALLLPSASASYELGNSEISRDYLNGAAPLSYAANSRALSWRVSQPVFSLERWSAWKEEDTRSVLAELRFSEASIELTLRLARSVFDTLLASDNLRLAQAQYKTMLSRRMEAEQLRQAGVLTLTEVEDSRARELSAKAGELEADFGLQMRRQELTRIVGVLTPDSPLPLPQVALGVAVPDDLAFWLGRVRDANPKVVSAATALKMATHGASKSKAAHLPTLDLVASATQTHNPNNYTSLERSGGVSLRLSVPLFEGGRTSAGATRAEALREQSRFDLETARRDAEVKATEAFLGLANASAKYHALAQALIAAKTSLQGTLIGRQTGLRTHTDVLNAEQQVFAVERDLSKERYNHALAGLQLKALSGQLTEADLVGFIPESQGKH